MKLDRMFSKKIKGVAHLEGSGQEAQPIIHPSLYQWGGMWDDGGTFPPPHAYVTQSHPGCLRRQCRLLAEPHQSPIRIKASEGVRWTSTLAPGTSVPQTTVGTRPGPPQTAQAVWLPAGAIPLRAHGRGVSVPAAGGVGIQAGWH